MSLIINFLFYISPLNSTFYYGIFYYGIFYYLSTKVEQNIIYYLYSVGYQFILYL